MDEAKKRTPGGREAGGSRFANLFFSGMERLSLSAVAQTSLSALAAAQAVGILLGILGFFLWGEAVDAAAVEAAYFRERAFISYPTVSAFCRFFAGWVCHHLVWILLGGMCTLTLFPGAAAFLLCLGRGVLAGFGISALSTASVGFCVFYAVAQSALCALLLLVCAKAVRYGKDRAAAVHGAAAAGRRWSFSAGWLFGEVLPLLAGMLLCAFVQTVGMLLVSGAACLLIS